MIPSENWKSFFTDWPADLPHNGVLVSTLKEAIPFKNFWLKNDLLLLERTVPDATGGRFLLLGFEVINLIKFINPLTEATILESGFVASSSNKLQPSY
ncbi:MAG: hypothetical protein IH831_05860 [Planctomycetes bacterium]|nr:hypothetical protein [Planctomycetota bacterium]